MKTITKILILSTAALLTTNAHAMNKGELIDAVSAKTGLDREEAIAAVEAMLDSIAETLADGDSVSLVGFGTFSVQYLPARMVRNPLTGEAIMTAGRQLPGFKAGKRLQDIVNGVATRPNDEVTSENEGDQSIGATSGDALETTEPDIAAAASGDAPETTEPDIAAAASETCGTDVEVSGIVKWWSDSKEFGFLERECNQDVFVHISALRGSGLESLKEGQEVRFRIFQGQKGPQARNVTVQPESQE